MNLALFDFDGTITDKDAFTEFLYFATPAHRKLFGWLLLFPFIIAYKMGFIPAHIMRPATAFFSFRKRDRKSLDALGEKFVRKWVNKHIRPEALEQLEWHRRRGDHIVIVSASLDTYLRPFCREQQVDLICSTLEHDQQVYTGHYVQGDCSHQAKAERVEQSVRLQDYRHVYAYGDTPEDKALLSLADIAVYQWDHIPR